MLFRDIFPPRPIQFLIVLITLERKSLYIILCIERHTRGFNLYLLSEIPPILQNVLNTHRNAWFFNFLSTGFVLDSTLESNGILRKNGCLSLRPAKKTTVIAILDKTQFTVPVFNTRFFKMIFYSSHVIVRPRYHL